ncbi:translation initiation factor IF-3 [Paenibacillus sp. CAU 1782]
MASKIVMNEQIKASEVVLKGLNGEDLGVVDREEALKLAREQGADLVCDNLLSSPPPCRLVAKGNARRDREKQQQEERKAQGGGKLKEIRLTPGIEDHDYDTKLRSAEKLLGSGNRVLLSVQAKGKESAKAKELLERMLTDLAGSGRKTTGIQVSGKGAAVEVAPLNG